MDKLAAPTSNDASSLRSSSSTKDAVVAVVADKFVGPAAAVVAVKVVGTATAVVAAVKVVGTAAAVVVVVAAVVVGSDVDEDDLKERENRLSRRPISLNLVHRAAVYLFKTEDLHARNSRVPYVMEDGPARYSDFPCTMVKSSQQWGRKHWATCLPTHSFARSLARSLTRFPAHKTV